MQFSRSAHEAFAVPPVSLLAYTKYGSSLWLGTKLENTVCSLAACSSLLVTCCVIFIYGNKKNSTVTINRIKPVHPFLKFVISFVPCCAYLLFVSQSTRSYEPRN